jgi:hypothetical protein
MNLKAIIMKKKEKARERDFPFQYAAKFICTSNIPGTSQTTAALLPGAYLTSVNIHNPHDHEIRMQKKLASPIQISDYITGSLKPDGVKEWYVIKSVTFNIQTFMDLKVSWLLKVHIVWML